jgi:hypothetical protein
MLDKLGEIGVMQMDMLEKYKHHVDDLLKAGLEEC